MFRINFSGHPVAGIEVSPLVGVNLPLENAEELRDMLSRVLDAMPMASQLREGAAAEVVLPGMSTAAGIFLALWHGKFGSFPTIIYMIRGEGGFQFTPQTRLDLQQVRLEARTSRTV